MLWGTSGLFVAAMTPYGLSTWQITALRGVVAFLFLALYALLRDRRLFAASGKELLLFLCIGASLFGTSGFYFASLHLTSVATAVVLMYTAPIFVMLVSVLLLGELFTKRRCLALVTVLLGCALVSGIADGFSGNGLGILFGFLSGISYASYNILTKIATRRGICGMKITLYGSLFMALLSLCICRPLSILGAVADAPLPTLSLTVLLGVLTFILPYLFYAKGLSLLPAGVTASLSVVEPMAASLFGIFILGEAPTVFSVLGILLILTATLLLVTEKAPKKLTKEKKFDMMLVENKNPKGELKNGKRRA